MENLSHEKSTEQAGIIISIIPLISLLDVDYCKDAARQMKDQVSRQESMAVLNPSYSQVNNDIIREQANALLLLAQYVESLKKVDELKKEAAQEKAQFQQIQNLFL